MPNLSVWLYSRSGSSRPSVLFYQMEALRETAEKRGYIIIGNSQDMGTGRSIARVGLRKMMQAARAGTVHAVLVQNLTRLSHDLSIQIKILEFLQDYGTILVTTESDLRYELYIRGLEDRLIRRAIRKGCGLPWRGGEDCGRYTYPQYALPRPD